MAGATEREIASQPECWRRAAGLGREGLPERGERVAVVGCGTSWFVAQAWAAARERAGHGETDAFAASETPGGRRYDRVVAISRSGTTTEVIRLLETGALAARRTLLTTVADAPAAARAEAVIALAFADEESIVQTRFATSALALLRAHLGHDVTALAAEAERALAEPPVHPAALRHFVFLGRGMAIGLAHEAALKLRELAGAWTEAHPAMEYRHGPVSAAGRHSLVWSLSPAPPGLEEEVCATGAVWRSPRRDPMVELVGVQRLGLTLAAVRGLDPDVPRHLSRSVILPG